MGNLVNFHHHAVNGEGHVAAVDRSGAVDAHEVVEHNLHQCGQYLCQKTGKAQLENPKGQGPGRAQGGAGKAHRLEPAQVEQAQGTGGYFADHRGNPRTDDPQSKPEDKNRIEDDIDGGACHHAFHRILRRTVGPNHGGKGRADKLKRKSDGDGPKVGKGFVVGRVRGAEEPHDPRREHGSDNGHDESAHDDPRHAVAEDTIRRILIFSPQAEADVGGTTVAEHEADGVDEDGHGKGHVYRRHAGDSRTPAHKDLIDDIINVIDHKGQGRRHRVADKELRDRLRRQRAVDGLRLFHHAPSFLRFSLSGSLPQIKTSGDMASPREFPAPDAFFERQRERASGNVPKSLLLPSRPDCWLRSCTESAMRSRAFTASRIHSFPKKTFTFNLSPFYGAVNDFM